MVSSSGTLHYGAARVTLVRLARSRATIVAADPGSR